MITPIAIPAAAPLESPPDESLVEMTVGAGDVVVNIGASTDVEVGVTMPAVPDGMIVSLEVGVMPSVEMIAPLEVGAEELEEVVTVGKLVTISGELVTISGELVIISVVEVAVSNSSKLSVGSAMMDPSCLTTMFCCNCATAGSASRV